MLKHPLLQPSGPVSMKYEWGPDDSKPGGKKGKILELESEDNWCETFVNTNSLCMRSWMGDTEWIPRAHKGH